MPTRAPANDAQLAQSVRQSLSRERAAGEDRISVSSCSCVITLHGTVVSTGKRRTVESLARKVPGVADVENKLAVR